MAQHEVQAKRGLFSFFRRLIGTDSTIITDILEYDNPKAAYNDNELPHWAAVVELIGAGGGYNPPPPIITNIPAGTVLTNQVYYNIPFDIVVYGEYPTVIIGLTEVGGVQPVTVEAPVKYQYFHGNILVYLPNDGSGITLDPYKVIIKA